MIHDLWKVSAVPDPIVDAQSAAQEQHQLRYTNPMYERHVAVSLDPYSLEYPYEEEQSQLARSSYQNHHLMTTPDSRYAKAMRFFSPPQARGTDAAFILFLYCRREDDFTYTSLHPTPLTSYDRTVGPYAGAPENVHSDHFYGYTKGGPCQGSESSNASDYDGCW